AELGSPRRIRRLLRLRDAGGQLFALLQPALLCRPNLLSHPDFFADASRPLSKWRRPGRARITQHAESGPDQRLSSGVELERPAAAWRGDHAERGLRRIKGHAPHPLA